MALAGPDSDRENSPFSFPGWRAALDRAALPADGRAQTAREEIAFFHSRKVAHAPATVARAQRHLEGLAEAEGAAAREALRWLFRAARAQAGGGAGSPLGGAVTSPAPPPYRAWQPGRCGRGR